MEWKDGMLKNATVTAAENGAFMLKLNSRVGTPNEKQYSVENGILKAEMAAGESVRLTF